MYLSRKIVNAENNSVPDDAFKKTWELIGTFEVSVQINDRADSKPRYPELLVKLQLNRRKIKVYQSKKSYKSVEE